MRAHDTSEATGRSCWCRPRLEQICPVLAGRREEGEKAENCLPNCWRCGGQGTVPAYDAELHTLVIHNREPD